MILWQLHLEMLSSVSIHCISLDEHDVNRSVTDVFAFLPDRFFIRIQWSCVHFYGRRILTRAAAVQLYTTRPSPCQQGTELNIEHICFMWLQMAPTPPSVPSLLFRVVDVVHEEWVLQGSSQTGITKGVSTKQKALTEGVYFSMTRLLSDLLLFTDPLISLHPPSPPMHILCWQSENFVLSNLLFWRKKYVALHNCLA